MGILDFIVSVLGALAWPTAVLIIFALCRKPLLALIPLISRIKFRDLQLAITNKIEEAKKASTLPSTAALLASRPDIAGEADRLYSLISHSPRSAIMEAWRLVETTGNRVVAKHLGPEVPPHLRSPFSIGEALRSRELISVEQYKTLTELRRIRNEAVHAPEFVLSPEAVKDYVDLAVSLKSELEKL